jgi:hypothetical protein
MNARKRAQWAAFHRRNRLDEKNGTLAETQAVIAKLVQPALVIARKTRR